MKVIVADSYDGFSIIIKDDDDGLVERWWFNQEDTRENMVKVFKTLGIEAEYEEDC